MMEVWTFHAHAAKIPFLPLRDIVAENPVLYGVLSLLNLICGDVRDGIKDNLSNAHHDRCGV